MGSLKVVAAFGLVFVFLLGGLSLAMAAVTAPIQFPEATAELSVRSGSVELQKSGSTTWVAVSEIATVEPGDSVRTAADSEASINLYDQGVVHVAPDTTMTLDSAVWNPDMPEVFSGSLLLSAGDLWSRVFDFVSSDSNFSVTTSSTVATVRGTTFWVGAWPNNTSRVYVDDHVVSVESTEGRGTLDVRSGQQVRLYREGRQSMLNFAEPPSDKDFALIEKYRGWDADYEAEVTARQLEFARRARRIDPESPLYSFQRLSEHLRLALAPNEEREAELRERFMTGRVLDAYVEFAGKNEVTRAQVLLRHASEFGGSEISERPQVRRAALYFGRDHAEFPAQLEDLIQDEPRQELDSAVIERVPEATIDTQVQFDVKLTDPGVSDLRN